MLGMSKVLQLHSVLFKNIIRIREPQMFRPGMILCFPDEGMEARELKGLSTVIYHPKPAKPTNVGGNKNSSGFCGTLGLMVSVIYHHYLLL